MNKLYFIIFIFISINFSVLKSEIIYLDPAPNSKLVNTNNSLIIGTAESINPASLNNFSVTVTGVKSGLHNGVLKLLPERGKILFKPSQPFALDERVDVVISSGLRTNKGAAIPGKSYSFYTQRTKLYQDPLKSLNDEINPSGVFKQPNISGNNFGGDPPHLSVITYNNPVQEDLFLSSFPVVGYPPGQFLIIADPLINPYYIQELPANAYDFKEQPNGNLTYYRADFQKFYEMNIQYDIVDSFACGNGYTADLHEMRLLTTGHALLLAYDPEIVDMSQIVTGGDPNATVVGLIVQEVDNSGNVYFQWRSWDHFLITDATHEVLTSSYIDYVHGNAIEYYPDGNLIISSRHMDELTKIDIQDGDIIWRMGGKNNEFGFISEPLRFSHQHAVRRLSNGNLTLFDNGNYRTPPDTRAIEYLMDETNKTATLVWQYYHSPSVYSTAMGYVERLENGNSLISWGYSYGGPMLTEVTPSGDPALEVSMPNGYYTYRAFKYHWIGEPLNIHTVTGNIPVDFSLGQNYPNPFNPTTTFQFDVPKSSVVEITLFDINGRHIRTLVNKQLTAGKYSASIDGSGISSGVYFYRLRAGDLNFTRKMVLMK